MPNNSKIVLVPHFMAVAGVAVLQARPDVTTVVYPAGIGAEEFRTL